MKLGKVLAGLVVGAFLVSSAQAEVLGTVHPGSPHEFPAGNLVEHVKGNAQSFVHVFYRDGYTFVWYPTVTTTREENTTVTVEDCRLLVYKRNALVKDTHLPCPVSAP